MKHSHGFSRVRPLMLLAFAMVAGTVLLGNGQKSANGWIVIGPGHGPKPVPCYTCDQNYSADTTACWQRYGSDDRRLERCMSQAQKDYYSCISNCN